MNRSRVASHVATVLSFVVCVIGLLLAWGLAPSLAADSKPVPAILASWPLPPPPEQPVGKPPDVAGLLVPMPTQLRAQLLIAQHPDPEVSGVLIGLSNARAVGYSLNSEKKGKRIAFTLGIDDTGKPMPVFVFRRDYIDGLATADAVYGAMLFLTHENTHYAQWRDNKTQYEKLRDATFEAGECHGLWEKEYEAYEAECMQARAWGVADKAVDGACRYVASPAFSQAVFTHLISTQPADGGGPAASCVPEWARIAGHPDFLGTK